MKKTIIAFILGGIIFSSITATAAYVYTARDIGYQPSDEDWSVDNVQEALTELKTDVNTITNKVEGIERVYKAGEVELVALVSDDSFYIDSNGNYVLSNSDTGRTLLADTNTYKSIASTEDCIGEVGADTTTSFSSMLSKACFVSSGWTGAAQDAFLFADDGSVTSMKMGQASLEDNNLKVEMINSSSNYFTRVYVKNLGTKVKVIKYSEIDSNLTINDVTTTSANQLVLELNGRNSAPYNQGIGFVQLY